MSRMLLVATALLVSGLQAIAEEARTWTNRDGREIVGTLIEKDATHVKLLVENKRFRIPIDSLSEADRDHIAKAKVYPELEVEARTVKVDSNEANSKYDARKVSVKLEKLAGRKVVVRVVWIGKGRSGVDFHAMEEKQVAADGEVFFSTVYRPGQGRLLDYRGYAVGVADDAGRWIAVQASQKPYERFIYERAGEAK